MHVLFEKVFFMTVDGVRMDIKDLVVEIDIYQNLFDHYMRCSVVLSDGRNLDQTNQQKLDSLVDGGFTGLELLVLQYTSEDNTTISNCFSLYERTSRLKVNESVEAYTLNGISLEAMQTFPVKISRAYGGTSGRTVEQMIQSIYDEFFLTEYLTTTYSDLSESLKISFDKVLLTDSTSGIHKFVIPNMSVDDTIEFLCNEADSADHIPQYLFYENYYGFYFYNLSTLVESSPIFDYYYVDSNVADAEQNELLRSRDQRNIISYKVKKESNILEDAREGLYKSKTLHLDMHKKKLRTTVFDYEKEKTKFKTLQPFFRNAKVSVADAHVLLTTTRTGHDNDGIMSVENHLPKKLDEFAAARKSYTKHIFNKVMTVNVPGTTMLNVGDTVSLYFPYKNALIDSLSMTKNDPDLSGKYIITKVRNKFNDIATMSEFYTTIECVKDSQIIGSLE